MDFLIEVLKLTNYIQKETEKLYNSCLAHQQTYIDVRNIKEDESMIIQTLFFQQGD